MCKIADGVLEKSRLHMQFITSTIDSVIKISIIMIVIIIFVINIKHLFFKCFLLVLLSLTMLVNKGSPNQMLLAECLLITCL